MEVWNQNNGVRLAWEVEEVRTWWRRLYGCITRRRDFASGGALLNRQAFLIHTWFMKAPIDVAFLDREGCVVLMMHTVAPFKLLPIVRGAVAVLKFPAGTLSAAGTQCGDCLRFEAVQRQWFAEEYWFYQEIGTTM